jgi:hypothetical protein
VTDVATFTEPSGGTVPAPARRGYARTPGLITCGESLAGALCTCSSCAAAPETTVMASLSGQQYRRLPYRAKCCQESASA